jgi:hypothetical protein
MLPMKDVRIVNRESRPSLQQRHLGGKAVDNLAVSGHMKKKDWVDAQSCQSQSCLELRNSARSTAGGDFPAATLIEPVSSTPPSFLIPPKTLLAMSFSTVTPSAANTASFEQVSMQWRDFLAFKPYSDFKRSQMTPGRHGSRLDFTLIKTINALGNWLSQLQLNLAQQGLSASELALVLFVLQYFEPGLRSLLEKSLAKELVPEELKPENVGFNTLQLHLETWSRFITGREHTLAGDVGIAH